MTYEDRRQAEEDRYDEDALPEGSMLPLVLALAAAVIFGAWVAGIIR